MLHRATPFAFLSGREVWLTLGNTSGATDTDKAILVAHQYFLMGGLAQSG